MISGGFATMTLADFGADVVKIEHPEYTDPLRDWPPMEDGTSLWWKSIGRNKQCITLDLKSDEGRELALELVEEADVVFENFRPGKMEEWDLGYEDLEEVNEDVIFVRISGYGQTGPMSHKPGFGTVAEAMSGWAHVNGFEDREPLLPPISLADLVAALYAVQSTMFAIFERDVGSNASGEGQVIDVSLYEPLFRLFVSDVEAYDKTGWVPQRTGNSHPNSSPRGVYETEDGYIALSASAQAIFERVMHAIDRPELIEDERFETNEDRVEHAEEIDAVIEEWTRKRPTEEVIEVMDEKEAIVGPINDISDIFEDEQFRARNDIVEIEDEDVGSLKTPNAVPKFSRTPGGVSHAGPRHGQHNEAIFREELDLSEEELEKLREKEVI
jgi:formyl-CoA transferase